jgi:glycosyltransferase involved in cell wall biosynthesis
MPTRTVFYPEMVAFGGAERVVLALSKHLRHRDIPHELALYYLSVDLQAHAQWTLPIRQLNPPRNPLTKARRMKDYLSRQQAAGSGTALLVGIQAALHAGVLGASDYILMILDTPSLMSPAPGPQPQVAGLSRSLLNLGRRLILCRGMRRAKRVIATSKYMADEMRRRYGIDSIIARQGGLSPVQDTTKRVTNGRRGFRMLSVSRLEPNKRIDWILHALSRPNLPARDILAKTPWHLDIVGDGSERSKLENQARLLGLESRVTFLGHVSDERLEELYDEASIFLMPAFQGYGLPALEALSRRVPVVMHRDSGVSEILYRTPWVELIEGDAESLSAGLASMLNRLRSGRLATEPLPAFPSESDWAEQICRTCGWS